MIDHFGINCADYAKSQEFYDRALGVLGYTRQINFGEATGWKATRTSGSPRVRAWGRTGRRISPSPPPATPATSRRSSETPTATTSKPSATRRVGGYV
jgi:catechol 2,3-dioxygenase-like lactoylglutathione lyase family enzyme